MKEQQTNKHLFHVAFIRFAFRNFPILEAL